MSVEVPASVEGPVPVPVEVPAPVEDQSHLVVPAPLCEPREPGLSTTSRRRRPHPAATPCRAVTVRGTADAAAFTEATLRLVLEVVDRRRPIGQLAGYLGEAALTSVAALVRSRPAQSAAVARVHRVRVQGADQGAVEIFGTFTRGHRVHAFAGRLEAADGPRRPRFAADTPLPGDRSGALCAALPAHRMRPRPRPEWTVTALHLG